MLSPSAPAPRGCSHTPGLRQPLGWAAKGRTPGTPGAKAHGTITRYGAQSRGHVGSFSKRQALRKQVLRDPHYREHSCYMGEASFGLGLLKTENTTVGPATRAGRQKQGWAVAGRVRSPLQAAFSNTGQISYPAGHSNAPTPAELHLEWSPSPHQPQPWLPIAFNVLV